MPQHVRVCPNSQATELQGECIKNMGWRPAARQRLVVLVRFRFRLEKVAHMHVHERHSVFITAVLSAVFPRLCIRVSQA